MWLLQEQSEDALATLSALRDGRITTELQPLLAGLLANVAYQQWLAAWNSQPGSSRIGEVSLVLISFLPLPCTLFLRIQPCQQMGS